MPYIKDIQREYFNKLLDVLHHSAIANPGELNFLFTEIIKQYMVTHSPSYQTFNDIVGALTSCNMELYRRRIAPYEDSKIEENGDVYDKVS